jgi:hypothetical protein
MLLLNHFFFFPNGDDYIYNNNKFDMLLNYFLIPSLSFLHLASIGHLIYLGISLFSI